MKIRKFNENKSGEKLQNYFDDFIEELSESGGHARTELSHSNFTYEDKDIVVDTINFYEDLLKKVNNKFEKVKRKVKDFYNEKQND